MALVVKSAIRDVISKADMRVSGDFWNDIDATVEKSIKAAIKRAKENGRKTLRGIDL